MIDKIKSRMASEQGFTLIELLVVIIIIGILLAIAVPSYLGFKDRAANNATKANLRAALPSAEAYYGDNGTYVGMTPVTLKAIDSGVSASLTVASATATAYCLTDTVSGKTWSVKGPGPSATNWYTSNDCT